MFGKWLVAAFAANSFSSFPFFPKTLNELSREAANASADLFSDRPINPARALISLNNAELVRPNWLAASAEEEECLLLLDFLLGMAEQLQERGFSRLRCYWSTFSLCLSARTFFLRAVDPLRISVDVLGVGDVAEDDQVVVLVRPNNLASQKVLEHVQTVCIQAQHLGVPVIMLNPELLSYPAVGGFRHTPMLLRDFEPAYYVDPEVYIHSPSKICGLLRRYPRPWEVYCLNSHRQDLGWLYFAQSNAKPSLEAIAGELIANGLHVPSKGW
jgi:hypothetical protein